VLKTISKTGKTQYKDLSPIQISVSTLNMRLLQFLNFGLIRHYITRNGNQRKEWYEITKKGKIALEMLEKLGELIEK